MINDLKIIKKKYGEEFSHMCREFFPTILETPGLLSNFLLNHYEPNHYLLEDLIKEDNLYKFRDYITSSLKVDETKKYENLDSPKDLLSKAGYYLYEVKNNYELKEFMKYYKEDELLCTFKDPDRIYRCHIFFIIKKNVKEIIRENFKNPERQDEYGTSVVSIQFTRDSAHLLSIKNRYNHKVKNPDCTFSNNLDNIIPGLTESFNKYYGLKENIIATNIYMKNYIQVEDKFYKYNYALTTFGIRTFYCPNNIVIVNNKVKKYDKEKYIVMDYFILDLVNKKIILEENLGNKDGFLKDLDNIKNIKVLKNKNEKEITIETKEDYIIKIKLDDLNRIISYENNHLETLNNFLEHNTVLKNIKADNLKTICNSALTNKEIEELIIPENTTLIPSKAFYNNKIKKLILPSKVLVVDTYAFSNNKIETLVLNEGIQEIGMSAFSNNNIKELVIPSTLKKIDSMAFSDCKIEKLTLNEGLEIVGSLAFKGNKIKNLIMPNSLKEIRAHAFSINPIENVKLNNNLELIENSAFYMTNLKEIQVNEKTIISSLAFPENTIICKVGNKIK